MNVLTLHKRLHACLICSYSFILLDAPLLCSSWPPWTLLVTIKASIFHPCRLFYINVLFVSTHGFIHSTECIFKEHSNFYYVTLTPVLHHKILKAKNGNQNFNALYYSLQISVFRQVYYIHAIITFVRNLLLNQAIYEFRFGLNFMYWINHSSMLV
jgi:hypothetical protein